MSVLVRVKELQFLIYRHGVNMSLRNGGSRSGLETCTSILPGRSDTTAAKDEVHCSRQIISREHPWRLVRWWPPSTQSTISTHLVDKRFPCLAMLCLQRPICGRKRGSLRRSSGIGTGRRVPTPGTRSGLCIYRRDCCRHCRSLSNERSMLWSSSLHVNTDNRKRAGSERLLRSNEGCL